jgi:hypothetical protein
MKMLSVLEEIYCASIPVSALPLLAGLRCRSGITAALIGDKAWIRWPPHQDVVLRQVLSIQRVELYERRQGQWYRAGCHLPCFDFPADIEGQPLDRVLLPSRFVATAPGTASMARIALRLVRDDMVRPASALECDVSTLASWADTVSQFRLPALRAARCGNRVLVTARQHSSLRCDIWSGAERFWGERVLIPLGWRPEPEVAESAILEAHGVSEDQYLLWKPTGSEAIPISAFQSLSRGGIKSVVGGP